MLRVRLVGELRIDVAGHRLGRIASSRARSLLAWLAYHPGLHPRSRAQVKRRYDPGNLFGLNQNIRPAA